MYILVLMLVSSLLLSGPYRPPRAPAVGPQPGGPSAAAGMPCHPYKLADISQQSWVAYTCLETRGFATSLKAQAYEGHEQVHLRLSDGDAHMVAFWPAEQGKMTEGQYVRVRAMLVPLVNGPQVLGWGLLIIQWEPARPPLKGALEG
jgi:hypothetical protein